MVSALDKHWVIGQTGHSIMTCSGIQDFGGHSESSLSPMETDFKCVLVSPSSVKECTVMERYIDISFVKGFFFFSVFHIFFACSV
jgi:hypothetical protein